MRALVIDDSKPVRSILCRMFGELEFDVIQCCHGQEALDQLESESLPDVVTVNWNMPIMDGLSFIKAVRKNPRYQGLRIIMLSMEADPDRIAEAKLSGADDYLVKPLIIETLRCTLQKLGVLAVVRVPSERDPSERDPSERDSSERDSSERDSTRAGVAAVRRVLVVDDSVVIRRTLSKVLGDDPDLEVVATAADGRIALGTLTQVAVDVVLLDVEMPNMNGLETLKHLRKSHPALPVIMFSSLTERGAAATLDALLLGADDYVPKPAGVNDFGVAQQCIRDELIPRIKQLTDRRRVGLQMSAAPAVLPASARRRQTVEVVVIGISTGGPKALVQLVPQFAKTFPVPVVVVQHMPPVFTRHLAARLAKCGTLDVVEGQEGHMLRGGELVVAPGGSHTVLQRRGRELTLSLNQDPPEHSCRPAVDVLLRSAVSVCGGGTLAVIMTGMGKDGLRGCQSVLDAGGQVLAQDEASSVVWGMPGQVVRAGLADDVVPLEQLGAAIAKRLSMKNA